MSRTVVIVDDHVDFRAAARALLTSSGLEVVGEAADGTTALEVCRELRPDIVLLDIQLPDIDGFEVRERLLRGQPGPAVLLTSTRGAAMYGERLTDPEPIPFVRKDELSVLALTELLGMG